MDFCYISVKNASYITKIGNSEKRRDIIMKNIYAILIASILIVSCGGGENRNAAYLEKGDDLFESENYEKAQLEYRNSLQIDPKNATAHFKLANTYEKLKNWQAAVKHYYAVLQLEENHIEARVKLAQIFLLGGLQDKANELIEEALSINEDHPDVYAVRGAIKLQQGEINKAQENASVALKIDEDNALAKSLQVATYIKLGQTDKAISSIKSDIQKNPNNQSNKLLLTKIYINNEDYMSALDAVDSLIQTSPDQLSYRFQKVNILIKLNQLDDAEIEINNMLSDFKDNNDIKLFHIAFIEKYKNSETAVNKLKDYVASDEDNLRLKLALGDWYIKENKVDLAEIQYNNIISNEDHIESLDAYKRLVRIEFKKDNHTQALNYIEKIFEINPRDPDGLLLRGAYALSKKDAASAIADFRSILKDKPNDDNVLRLLAYAYLQDGQVSLAKEAIQQAVNFNNKSIELQLLYAQLLGAEGEGELAQDVLNELIANEKDNIQALKVMYDLQVSEKDWGAALETVELMHHSQPDSALPDYMQGLLFVAKGEQADAEKKFIEALEKEPNAVEPLTALVKFYVRSNQFEKARKYLSNKIQDNPDNAIAYNLLAEVSVQEEQNTKAIQYYEKAIDLQPNWWIPYRGIAAIMISNQNSDDALTILATGIENGADIERLGVDRALLLEKINEYEAAKAQYKEILVAKNDSKVATNNLAMLIVNHSSNDEELEYALNLVEQFATSNDPAYIDTYGWVQHKLGNHNSAIPALEKAVELAPRASELRYHLGMAYASNNEMDKAVEELKTAVESEQKFRGHEEAKAMLYKLTGSS